MYVRSMDHLPSTNYRPSQSLIFGRKYYILQSGNSQNIDREIVKGLHKQIQGLVQVNTVEECDVILVSCPIVSRAGTDVEAALKKLNNVSGSKPVVFMVLHHTFDPEKIVPDSSSFINRANTITLNMLFNEDDGLLKCDMNEQAVTQIKMHFKPQEMKNWLSHNTRVDWIIGNLQEMKNWLLPNTPVDWIRRKVQEMKNWLLHNTPVDWIRRKVQVGNLTQRKQRI